MDVKVCDRSVVALFGSIGNDVANSAWEENLLSPLRAPLPLPPGLASQPPPHGDGASPAGLRGAPAAAAPQRPSPDAAWVAVGAASDDDDDDYDAAKWVKLTICDLQCPHPACVQDQCVSLTTLALALQTHACDAGPFLWMRTGCIMPVPNAEQRMSVGSL